MDKHFYDFEEARNFCKDHTEDILNQMTEPDKQNKGYVCNLCGNGTGEDGDGLRFNPQSKDGKYIKCFSCGFYGDILEYVGQVFKIENKMGQIRKCLELLGYDNVILDKYQNAASTDYNKGKPTQSQPKTEQKSKTQEKAETEPDYTTFFLQVNKDIEKTDYHRGISLETLNRFKIGYCENWKHPKRPNSEPSPRLIIPTSKHSYVARDTRAELTEEQKQEKLQLVGSVRVFNRKALKEATQPIYVTESAICALSIIEVGGEAVATLSTNFINQFMEELRRNRPKQPLILAMDNDKAGKTATEKLKEALDEAKIDYYIYNPPEKYKDPNEALTADREAFTEWVNIGKDRKKAEQETYRKESAYQHLDDFMKGIVDREPAQPTGFKRLDEALLDGLRKGLYLIGAITSLGKTTLALQMADQIAQSGRDVIIFTLEMDAYELMSKSISRITYTKEMEACRKPRYAKTDIEISDGTKYTGYNKAERKLIKESITAYGEYAKHIYFKEGWMGEIGVEEIEKEIDRYIRIHEKKPVIFVDYFQALKPADVRATDKANADINITGLANLARQFKLPIIAISSFNRKNYNNEVTFDAFKESGKIEYSGDVVMGLQFHGVGEENFTDKQAKKDNPREVELVILKARKARVGATINFKYDARFNHFEEVEKFEKKKKFEGSNEF